MRSSLGTLLNVNWSSPAAQLLILPDSQRASFLLSRFLPLCSSVTSHFVCRLHLPTPSKKSCLIYFFQVLIGKPFRQAWKTILPAFEVFTSYCVELRCCTVYPINQLLNWSIQDGKLLILPLVQPAYSLFSRLLTVSSSFISHSLSPSPLYTL